MIDSPTGTVRFLLSDIAKSTTLIALQTGECFERDGDYFGSPLCVASRLVELTPPGSVWATEVTATLLSNTGPDTIQSVSLGRRVLRGLSAPIEILDIIRTQPDLIDSSPTPSHSARPLQHRSDAAQPAGIGSSFMRQGANAQVAPNRVAEAAQTPGSRRRFLPLQSAGPL